MIVATTAPEISAPSLGSCVVSEERLPYGKQISPKQINLRELLEIVREAAPDPKAAHAAIGAEFFPKPGDPKNEVISGMNAFLAMRHHGLSE
jgi:hypothetical protein